MGLLSIDQDKCKQDGLCAADCPVGIIRFEGPGHYPKLVQVGIPADYPHHYPMMIGFAKPRYCRLPQRKAP